MSHRVEQKLALRVAREARERERILVAARHRRMIVVGGVLAVVVAALAVAIVAGTAGGGSARVTRTQRVGDARIVRGELAGIAQSGNVLGDRRAPVTITVYGDLVCPVCRELSVSTEPQIIGALVRTGQAKLVFRGLETASATANAAEYVDTQVAARSAGLQGREWDYLQLAYLEQPQTIGGQPAETVPFVTSRYLQGIAAQIAGLKLRTWQADMTNPKLVAAVAADGRAALAAHVTGTPAIFVGGPRGTVEYDASGAQSAIPTLGQIRQLIAQVR
jgi:protein-disulfide isomerase